jgi:integrase
MSGSEPIRSYAQANQDLAVAFGRYMEARGFAAGTQKEYGDGVCRYAESLRATGVAEATRADVRMFLGELYARGLSASGIAKFTFGLRAFYKFLRLAKVAHHDPTITIPNRKLAKRLPRVLTVEEIERLIAAAGSPFERAVIEVLYSTGVRVSELVNLRLENVDMAEHTILVKKGKGGKDRYVLFGQYAAKAIAEYLQWRPSKTFLFEAPVRNGHVRKMGGSWVACFYVNKIQHNISVSATRPPWRPASRREVFVAAKKLRDGEGLTWPEIARRVDREGFDKNPRAAAHRIQIGVCSLTNRPPEKPRRVSSQMLT